MFSNEQIEVLDSELDSNRVKSRSKSNVNFAYLEGFDIMDTANRIFGFGNWSYALKKIEQVSQEINHNQNLVVSHMAIVSVTVFANNHSSSISREDVGFGTGISKSLADASENSAKEAVTDGLKRAMRGFGNQFGNSLYDKSKNLELLQNSGIQGHNGQNNNSNTHQGNHHQHNGQNANSMQNSRNVQSGQGVSGNRNSRQRQVQQTQYQQQQVQNGAMQNNNHQVQQSHQNNQNHTQNTYTSGNNYTQDGMTQDYTALYNLGLSVIEQGNNLVVIGDNLFSKKDSIKSYGFRWDSGMKLWYKPINEEVA